MHDEAAAGVSPHLSCLSRSNDLGHRTLAFPHFHIKHAVHSSNVNGKSMIERLNYLAVGTRCGLISFSGGDFLSERQKVWSMSGILIRRRMFGSESVD